MGDTPDKVKLDNGGECEWSQWPRLGWGWRGVSHKEETAKSLWGEKAWG